MYKRERGETTGKGLLGNKELISVLVRSFTIQASWNYERMLGLGFLFSILPGLRKISRDDGSLKSSAKRHIEFFNSHPYMASYALGSSLRLEEEFLRGGDVDDEAIRQWKKRLFTTLGSLGDNLIWKSWRPACGILGVLVSYLAGWIGPLLYLIIYNTVHLYVRTTGLFHSYFKGRESLQDLEKFFYRRLPRLLEGTICALLGSLVVILLVATPLSPASGGDRGIFLVMIVAFWALMKHFTPRALLYATSVFLMFGLFFWEIFIGR